MIRNIIIAILLLISAFLYYDKLIVESEHQKFLIVVEEVYAHLNKCASKHPGCDQ